MKKFISGILAIAAAFSMTTVSYATEAVEWTNINMSNATTMSSSLSSVARQSSGSDKYYGMLASNGAWARLQEYGTVDMGKFFNSDAAMYDVDNEIIEAKRRLAVRVAYQSGNATWYGGGMRTKLTDKEIMPGKQYKLTVKAGVAEGANSAMFAEGVDLYASFFSANSQHDMRNTSAGLLANYDANSAKNAAACMGELAVDKVTVDSTSGYQIKTYEATLTADESMFTMDGAYCGMTTLNLFVANRAEDGTWNNVMPAVNKRASLVVESVKIEPVDTSKTETMVKRGICQTFEKYESAEATSVTADKMRWGGTAIENVARYGTAATSQIMMDSTTNTAPRYSNYALLLVNIDGSAESLAVSRDYSSCEMRPGEKYNLTFHARVNQKAKSCPVTVSVGGTALTASSTYNSNTGNAIYGWKQFSYTFTAPEAEAYTDTENGKIINVEIAFSDTTHTAELRAMVDNVTLTAANQSFDADFAAATSEDNVSFYSNVYAGNEAIDATIFPVLFNSEKRFIKADTLRYFKIDSNAVGTLSDSTDVSEGNTLKLLYWDEMTPVADFDSMVRPAAE